MSVAMGKHDDVTTGHLDRCVLAGNAQGAAAEAEDVKGAVAAGGEVEAPSSSSLGARMQPPAQFEGIEYIGQYVQPDLQQSGRSDTDQAHHDIDCRGSPRLRL